jgi:protein-disulfide isomerase
MREHSRLIFKGIDPLRTTRRQFLCGISVLALATALSGLPPVDVAFAQTVPTAELMQAGPLGDMSMGKADAPITMIEYASATCSHCADFKVKTFPQVKEKYIDTGKVRFIFREFPFDPVAAGAFMLARCAATS